MALRGAQGNKEMGMPSSFSYNNNKLNTSKVSSSAAPINSSSPQTLDHSPLYNPELNPNRQVQKPADTADPASASTAARSSLKPPQQQPSQPPLPPVVDDPTTAITTVVRYRECLKNHAAGMGGHVVDGCGEFMASGEEGTPEALICAACECHRNFHRKEINGETQYAPAVPSSCFNYTRRQIIHPPHTMPPTAPVMMNFRGGGAAESSNEDLNNNNHNMFQYCSAGGHNHVPESSKKRFRTKFSQEQKDKMMEFGENLGWRIQKEDEVQVQQFCTQVGVERKVFKVWMHNNKQAMKKKQM